MQTSPIVADSPRFEITDLGRDALRASETCECRPRPSGGYLICPECGTYWKLSTYRQRGYVNWREK